MKPVACVTREGDLWWASFRKAGVNFKLPFVRRMQAVAWVVIRGFRVDDGERLRLEDALRRKAS